MGGYYGANVAQDNLVLDLQHSKAPKSQGSNQLVSIE